MTIMRIGFIFIGIFLLLGLPITALFAPQHVTLTFIPFEYKAERVWTGTYLVGTFMSMGGLFLIICSKKIEEWAYSDSQLPMRESTQ